MSMADVDHDYPDDAVVADPDVSERSAAFEDFPRGGRRARRAAVPPAALGTVGFLIVLLGAWAGIVPFVGPSFGFSGDGSSSWMWNLPHALLWVAPGAVAVWCGLMMLGLVPRAISGFGRLGSAALGTITAACGAWLVIGPSAWPVLEHSAGVFVPASPLRELAYLIGYSLGPGILLVLFGAFAIGWGVRSHRFVGPSALP
jgi:hypothetical protein